MIRPPLKELSDAVFTLAFGALVLSIMAFWFSYTYPQALNENMGVLLVFAERFFQGGEFGKDIYEVNPPLSIIIYIPVIWLKDLLGIDIHAASFLYISMYLSISTVFVGLLLRYRDKTRPFENLLIVSAYIISQLFITCNDYGEREHFVSLGLVPLCLLIYLKTNYIKVNKYLTFLISAFGIISILIKPHFGLAPAILFIHRAYKRKSLFYPIKDLDFIVMSLGTILYAIALVTVFKTYTFEFLPDIFSIYVTNVISISILMLIPLIVGTVVIIMMGLCWSSSKVYKQPLDMFYLFGILTCISFISFISQAKGLFYQTIPSMNLFMLTATLYFFHTLSPYIKDTRAALVALILPLIAVIIVLYPINFQFPDREKIRELPFAQWFKTYCPKEKECSAYIFHEAVDGIFSSISYTDTKFASRFAAHWFLPITMSTLERDKRGLTPTRLPIEIAKEAHDKFGNYVGEDFQNFKPDFVAIIKTEYSVDMDDPEAEKINFDFIEHYSQFDAFKQAWKNYKYVGTETVNRKYYFKGTGLDYDRFMTYDLYVRK